MVIKEESLLRESLDEYETVKSMSCWYDQR